jgi:hypothetical protein
MHEERCRVGQRPQGLCLPGMGGGPRRDNKARSSSSSRASRPTPSRRKGARVDKWSAFYAIGFESTVICHVMD